MNFLNYSNLNVEKIENFLKKEDLKIPKNVLKTPEVERMKLPSFAKNFCNFILKNKKIPKQEEFFNYYKKAEKITLSTDKELGLMVRIYKRFYPSIIRDIHFGFLIKELTFYEVYYNPFLDFSDGIDLLIDKKIAVHLWLATKHSLKYRKIKKTFRHNYKENGFLNIEIPLNCLSVLKNFPYKGKEINNFFLYSCKEVDYLKKIINEKAVLK